MFLQFLAKLCSTKSEYRSGLVTSVEQHLFVACVIMIILTQQSSALNPTHQTFEISECLTSQQNFHCPIKFPADKESHLRVVYKGLSESMESVCNNFLRLSVPEGMFMHVKVSPFEMSTSCEDTIGTFFYMNMDAISMYPCLDDNYVAVRDVSLPARRRNKIVTYYSKQNSIRSRIIFTNQTASFNVTLTVNAFEKNYREFLVVSYQTNTSGTITPYGFDGITDYAMDMYANSFLKPPPGHSIMISFPHFDIMTTNWCFQDRLLLYINNTYTWKRCGHYHESPQVYRATLHFYFISSTQSKGHSGVKIRFSFHGTSDVPDKLLTTRLNIAVFNCSVPFYIKFKQHLQCNLDTECVNAEDEASCSYSHGACEPGFLTAGSKCYKYIKLGHKRMTWHDASDVCLKQGLTLTSFPNLKEEEAFRDNILRFAFTANNIFFGLRTSDTDLPAMYREVWQWSSGTMAYYINIEEEFLFKPTCAAFNRLSNDNMALNICGTYLSMHYMFCEAGTHVMLNKSDKINLTPVETGSTFGVNKSTRFVSCSSHKTHDFLSCDQLSRCGAKVRMSCVTDVPVTSDSLEVTMFVCDSQTQTIHYTQLCDHHTQCFDSSDETFCIHQECLEKQCLNSQCVSLAQWCDGMAHCSDGSDETCSQFVTRSDEPLSSSTSGFHVVLFDGHGKHRVVPQGGEFPVCPPTHFMCPNHELCLPVYLRCNDVYDCSDKKDEENCDDVTCPGYYRCLGSAVCVHSDHVCDGVFQCPQQDDELLCELICPDDCLCQGLAFVCSRPFPVQNYFNLRYLDVSQSGLTPDRLFHNHYLVRLVMSSCGLQTLPVFTCPNMKFLDLSNNVLTNIGMHEFLNLSNLNFLNLSRNPIVNLVAIQTNTQLKNVHTLDLSHTALRRFESGRLWNIRHLKTLNLSHSMLTDISSSGFKSLTEIEFLDLRGTELKEYPVKMLQSLSSLQVVFSDVYKLCCQEVLPDQFSIQNCHTSRDEIASCKDLLRSEMYRLFLWISCCFALIGNACSFAAKIYMQRGKPPNSFNVFISNLNVADFFMGLYLAIVGSADQVYMGRYLWHDEEWKTGTGCQIAGFFSLLSCEMSAFIICFITLDRFLVMRFPFSQMHFSNTSAGFVCGLSWFVGVALAIVPLLPMTSDWKFYGQTGICIPLPVTRKKFKGHFYSFGILIVFNFLLFVFIAVGQLFIYMSVRDNSLITDKKSKRQATVARRLLIIVFSDFLCWFPIGLLGLLASNGFPISGEVNVAMGIFALPLNSALNPFLYTFNLLMEKRQKASEQRLLKLLQSRISG